MNIRINPDVLDTIEHLAKQVQAHEKKKSFLLTNFGEAKIIATNIYLYWNEHKDTEVILLDF